MSVITSANWHMPVLSPHIKEGKTTYNYWRGHIYYNDMGKMQIDLPYTWWMADILSFSDYKTFDLKFSLGDILIVIGSLSLIIDLIIVYIRKKKYINDYSI